MTPLRKYRLLLLAKYGGDHKAWYSKYCELMGEGLVTWALGMAFITDKGNEELKRMEGKKKNE